MKRQQDIDNLKIELAIALLDKDPDYIYIGTSEADILFHLMRDPIVQAQLKEKNPNDYESTKR